jgi:threonine dehydrogenase-like Zn-dependent dehydrogenase
MDTPEPGLGQVLVHVRSSGICGTDLKIARRFPDLANRAFIVKVNRLMRF